MNLRSIGRLIVGFFTRPVRLSDLAFVPRIVRSLAPSTSLAKGSSSAATPDFEPTRMIERPGDTVDAWGRSTNLAVSEEALDTLPAALQDEFAAVKARQPPADNKPREG